VWLLPIGASIALAAAVFLRLDFAGVILLATAAFFGVGEYIVMMHIQDSKMTLRTTRRMLRAQ
jgi:hypothetical protein